MPSLAGRGTSLVGRGIVQLNALSIRYQSCASAYTPVGRLPLRLYQCDSMTALRQTEGTAPT